MSKKDILPRLVTGTRDYFGVELEKHDFIVKSISKIYEKYGYYELRTPAFEYEELIENVYGNENDKLIYRILNSGVDVNTCCRSDKISEKCLKYDLTLPLMRYVYNNLNSIIFPFKRYQIQPVWRADRPQKGRYREFYQCDIDIVGSDSILCEVEMLTISIEVLTTLGFKNFKIRLNNREILLNIAKKCGVVNKIKEFCILIDKIDKIGFECFKNELVIFNLNSENIDFISELNENNGNIDFLKRNLLYKESIEMLEKLFDELKKMKVDISKFELDFFLARGLNYYTGFIYEIVLNDVKIGSIGGGGRYNYFAEKFEIDELKSVGLSFGIDRLCVAMDELDLFNEKFVKKDRILVANIGDFNVDLIDNLRRNFNVDMYLENEIELKKQLKYADKRGFEYVLIGNKIRNMKTGEQIDAELFINGITKNEK